MIIKIEMTPEQIEQLYYCLQTDASKHIGSLQGLYDQVLEQLKKQLIKSDGFHFRDEKPDTSSNSWDGGMHFGGDRPATSENNYDEGMHFRDW